MREEILSPYFRGESQGGIRRFDELPLSELEKLMNYGFVDRDEWNDCPGLVKVFLPFMRRYPEFKAHGYAVEWDRDDARTTVEGIVKYGPMTYQEIVDFTGSFLEADEFEIGKRHARCWYD